MGDAIMSDMQCKDMRPRTLFYIVFDVPRVQVDMERLQRQIYDALDRADFKVDFAVGYAPKEGEQ